MVTRYVSAPMAAMPLLTIIIMVLSALTGSDAFAAGGMESAVQEVLTEANAIAPALGTIAIIGLGISAMNGRISWTQALVVAVGIVIAADAANIAATVR